MPDADAIFKEITAIEPAAKPFSERTPEEKSEAWTLFLDSRKELPDDDYVTTFLTKRPLNSPRDEQAAAHAA